MTQNDLISWISPDGIEHPLNGEYQSLVVAGRVGAFMPAMENQEQQVPLKSGALMRLSLAKPRDLLLPLLITGADLADMRNQMRSMAGWFYAGWNQQDGIVRCTSPDGSQRDLKARYAEGMGGDESEDNAGAAWMYQILALHASDPFWYDVNYSVFSIGMSGSARPFLPALIPIMLSPSSISGSGTIFNNGQDETWPKIVIYGPATNPNISNTYIGPNGLSITKTMAFTITLGANDVLTIDTTPGIASITKQDGSNQWPALNLPPQLFSIAPGTNQIVVSAGGTTSATQIQILYKQRWLTL